MKLLTICTGILFAISSLTLTAQEKKIRVEKPFIVHDKTSKISRVDIRKDTKGAENIIQIDATNASGGAYGEQEHGTCLSGNYQCEHHKWKL